LNILIDENIPKMTLAALRQKGHDVRDIRGTDKEGITDSEIWDIARSENRILISTDKWFAGNRLQQHSGILVVLLHKPNRQKIHDRILLAIDRYSEQEWKNLIIIMRDNVQSAWRSRH
jgi:predicted nuclease of predicted toxin-antitoxin system